MCLVQVRFCYEIIATELNHVEIKRSVIKWKRNILLFGAPDDRMGQKTNGKVEDKYVVIHENLYLWSTILQIST